MQENSNLQLASITSRAIAYIIDDFIITILILVVFWNSLIPVSNNSEALVELIQIKLVTPFIVIKILYQTFFVWYYGATVGKMIVKIRVIDSSTWNRVSLLSSFFRAAGRIISEMIFYIGFLLCFFNSGKKTFHDFTGNTLVVNA